MSSTSGSRTNATPSPASARASASVSATNTPPSAANHAGIRCPHHNCRLTHQGWIFSIQLKKVFSHVFGTILIRPSFTAAIAGCANVAASTYHWSVSHGSITTPERSPYGVWIVRGSLSCSTPSLSTWGTRKPSALSRATTALRASAVVSPSNSAGIRPSAVCVTCAFASSMLSISPAFRPARLPTSKSLKSCPGVILTAPEPSAGSACSSATIGTSRPVIGSRTCRPTKAR